MKTGPSHIMIEDITSTTDNQCSTKVAQVLDFLWRCGTCFQCYRRPSWSGFMEVVMAETDTTYSTSSVVPVHFIHLDPGNLTTIYTTIYSYSHRNNVANKIRQRVL